MRIRVYQGESRRADENELLGEFEFTGFKKARRGEVRIEVTFEINADGIVSVLAKDQETGKVASTTLTFSSGLSDGELERILEADRTNRVQTDVAANEELELAPPPPPPPKVEAKAPQAAKPTAPAPRAAAAVKPAPAANPAAAPVSSAAPVAKPAPVAAPQPVAAAAAKPAPVATPKPAASPPEPDTESRRAKPPAVIAIAPSGPDEDSVIEEGSSDLLDIPDLSLDLETTQPSAVSRAASAASEPAAAEPAGDALELIDDLELLPESVPIEEADLEGIEIEANGDPALPTELMSGAESLFDHGADLSRYHRDDE